MDIIHFVLIFLCVCQVRAYAVFAHFMVTNTANYTLHDWEDDIKKARDASINAFALNMAYGDPTNEIALPMAFEAATNVGSFSLFFSFDYAGNGPWPKDTVAGMILKYSGYSTYYRYETKPFVTTFEGTGNAKDWISIKLQTGCFFIPDWSSLGAKEALEVGGGDIVDGLFSWAAWPWGPRDMDTYTDASYLQFLNQTGNALPYMMPVSPWFYTNLPGYGKNWLWRGDHLWRDRWLEAWYVRPEFIQIISWNDYGESHYIGPLRDDVMEAFYIGQAPFNYATNMPHDGWRTQLKYLAETYKYGNSTIHTETLVAWYRLQPADACGTGRTSANAAGQLQLEFDPREVMQDSIFISALLSEPADMLVTIGGSPVEVIWRNLPDDQAGIYYGYAPFDGHTGEVEVHAQGDRANIASIWGEPITTNCTNGLANWNAWVGSAQADTSVVNPATSPSIEELVCVNGTGSNDFSDLCDFSCKYGYCPVSACTCMGMGEAREKPNATGVHGYPLEGLSASYKGLCSFDCTYGYCPDDACTTVPAPVSTPTRSVFAPPACIAGTGEGNLAGLCSFSCAFGFCPLNSCTCTEQGKLVVKEPTTPDGGTATRTEDEAIYGPLCNFACRRGYCPPKACIPVPEPSATGANGPTITIDGSIWQDDTPAVTCTPPCEMIMPPMPLPSPTMITFPDLPTKLTVRETATSTTTYNNGDVTTYLSFVVHSHPTLIPIEPIVAREIPVWHQTITPGQTVVYQTSSVVPPPFGIIWTPTIGGTSSIINGTTTTIPALTYSSGTLSYTRPPTSMVVGGTTSVSDETPLPPRTTRITPGVYPKETSPPDTTKTKMDSPFTVKTSGPPGPQCTANCESECIPFCIVGCPFCPPFFGIDNGGGGGGDNGNNDSPSSTTDTSFEYPEIVTAAGMEIGSPEAFPTDKPLKAELSSISKAVGSIFSSLYASSSGSDGSSGSEPTTTPVGPAPSNGPYAGAILIIYYENTHTGSGEWDLYEFYANDINVGGCPEIAGPDYVKTDGAYAGMTDGTGGFKAFGATCRYEGQNLPTNSWDQKAVGKFVCDKYRSAICYERSGGGTCAHGWQVTSRVLQCEW